jgi:hypothetical protein
VLVQEKAADTEKNGGKMTPTAEPTNAKTSIPPPTPTPEPTCKTANCMLGNKCIVWDDGVRGTSVKALEVALDACQACGGFLHGICGSGELDGKWCPACSEEDDAEVRFTYGTHLPVCTP